MRHLSIGQPADTNVFKQSPVFRNMIQAFAVGYYFGMSPLQLVTAWNALANDGVVVAPSLSPEEEPHVLDSTMTSKKIIRAIRDELVLNGKRLFGDSERVAVYEGISSIKGTMRRDDVATCCGFWPVEKPAYTCLVTIFTASSPQADPETSARTAQETARSIFIQLVRQLPGR
jgi:cell division protein FtsI/penicillin-binding protein 2